jgi:hypothetical protein
MATPALPQLMDALAARLDSIGLRASAESPGSINPPAAIVGVPPIPEYRAAFGRGTVYLRGWPITVLTSAKVDRIGQRALATYASWTGDKSVPLALEADPTLGGLIDDLAVVSFRPLGLEEVGIIQHFGGVFSVDLSMSGLED